LVVGRNLSGHADVGVPKPSTMRLCLIPFLMLPGLFWAQSDLPCGTDSVHVAMLQQSEAYERSFFAVQEAIERMREENRTVMEEYTVPVVVHVIHRGSNVGVAENISDEQILSAIEALNEDFRKLPGTNGDGLGVDTYIQFELAKRTPNDEPTNGIVRVDGRSVPEYLEHGIAMDASQPGADQVAVKSLTTWYGEDYLNFFVVPEINGNDGGNGIQGYAYLGPTGNALDGVTILYNVFGTEGELKDSHNMNRTTTHEVGHHLGLFHTFWLTSTCSAEVNCESQGDMVCDTPPTSSNNSCLNPECPDAQVENYMDYTPQTCRNTFTAGQRERMRGTLESSRASLLESDALVPVSEHDLVVASVLDPATSTCLNSAAPSLRVYNQGTESLQGFEIHFALNGGTTFMKSFGDTLAGESAVNVSLPEMSIQPGINELLTVVKKVGGESDDFPTNDTLLHTFELVNSDYWHLELTTDIWYTETSWELTDSLGNVLWEDSNFGLALESYTYEGCMPLGCHSLTLFDAAGDGMTWGGAMTLTNGNGEVLAELNSDNDDFGNAITFTVCATPSTTGACADDNGNGVCDDAEVAGCQDPTACNWNPEAILPGEACTYSDGIYDCFGACLSDTDGDGVCDPLEVLGCQELDACDYNASATDAGPCTYPENGFDCEGNCLLDGDGDGVCDEFEVLGCMDTLGCNYDVNATDAGECDYAEEGYDCLGNPLVSSLTGIDAWPAPVAFPNPMMPEHSAIQLSGLPSEDLFIDVISTEGRVVWQGQGMSTSPGVMSFPIRESVVPGTYFIRIHSSIPFGNIPLMVW